VCPLFFILSISKKSKVFIVTNSYDVRKESNSAFDRRQQLAKFKVSFRGSTVTWLLKTTLGRGIFLNLSKYLRDEVRGCTLRFPDLN